VLLGRLLDERRRLLGYTYRAPGFERDTGVNRRLAADLETAAPKRVDHFTEGSLRLAAHGYQVAYESMLAVLRGEADDLAPPGFPVAGEPPAWMAADEKRTAANRPYRDKIMGRLDLLAGQGVRSPSGAQLFPGSPADARDWDKYTEDWEIDERVWFVADLQRRAVGRIPPNSGTGTAGG